MQRFSGVGGICNEAPSIASATSPLSGTTISHGKNASKEPRRVDYYAGPPLVGLFGPRNASRQSTVTICPGILRNRHARGKVCRLVAPAFGMDAQIRRCPVDTRLRLDCKNLGWPSLENIPCKRGCSGGVARGSSFPQNSTGLRG